MRLHGFMGAGMERKKAGYTDMYLQAVWQLSHRLLQEQSHEQEVELGHVGVLGQQRLKDRQSGEVARVPVDLSHCGAPACTAAHVEACKEGKIEENIYTFKNGQAVSAQMTWD